MDQYRNIFFFFLDHAKYIHSLCLPTQLACNLVFNFLVSLSYMQVWQQNQVGAVDYSYWPVQAQERHHMIYPPTQAPWPGTPPKQTGSIC